MSYVQCNLNVGFICFNSHEYFAKEDMQSFWNFSKPYFILLH